MPPSSLLSKVHAIRKLGLTVVKTGEITGKNKIAYASYVDVKATLRPALDEYDLSTGFIDGEITSHGDGDRVSVSLIVSNGVERETTGFQILMPEKIMNSYGSSVINSGQRSAAAYSYARRNALICYFDIITGDMDDVERMTPKGDQSNIPGLIRVTERTQWQDLTDGAWKDTESPLEDGKLEPHCASRAAMVNLWNQFPNHPGLVACAADWIDSVLQREGLSWADVMEMEPALPASMQACDGPAMRLASQAASRINKQARAQGGRGE